MAAQSKIGTAIWFWMDVHMPKLYDFLFDVSQFIRNSMGWCKSDTTINIPLIPDFTFKNMILCVIVGILLAIPVLLLLMLLFEAGPIILEALMLIKSLIGSLFNALKSIFFSLRAPVDILYTLLKFFYSIIEGGISGFKSMFFGGATAGFLTGNTIAGALGVNVYLMRIFVFNLMAMAALKAWYGFLVDHDKWVSSPTFRVFEVINKPLATFKSYLKDFLPSFIYPVVSSFFFPVEATEMLLASIVGFVYYLIEKK